MTIYVTDHGDFTTKIINGIEVMEDDIENPKAFGKYGVIGSVSDECVVMKFGVLFKNEYISKENFCKIIDDKVKIGSMLVSRLMNDDGKNFSPLGKDYFDLAVTKKIMEIRDIK